MSSKLRRNFRMGRLPRRRWKSRSGSCLLFMKHGSSEFESVETDFFNIASIVNRINFNTPEGLMLSSKLSDVIGKLKITEKEFSKYSTEHQVINNEKITNDASVSFYVIANAYKEVSDGWYTKMIFNPDAVVQGYAYAFSLSGKGYGKEEDVIDAIEKSFSGYKKDDTQSTDDVKLYSNDKQLLILFIKSVIPPQLRTAL